MLVEIKHINGTVLYSVDLTNTDPYPLRTAVVQVVRERKSLADANLADANLAHANLNGARLEGAIVIKYDSTAVVLMGKSPVKMLGPIGSRNDTLVCYRTDQGIYMITGCFIGTVEQFSAAVSATHPQDSEHYKNYMKAIAFMTV